MFIRVVANFDFPAQVFHVRGYPLASVSIRFFSYCVCTILGVVTIYGFISMYCCPVKF